MEIRQGGRRPGSSSISSSSRHLSCRRSQRSPFLALSSKLKIEVEEEEEVDKKQAEDEQDFNELGARLLLLPAIRRIYYFA